VNSAPDDLAAHRAARVLHVQKVKGIGGSERHLVSLLPALCEAGIEVRMWAATTEDGEQFVGALRERGVHVTRVAAGPHLNPDVARSLWGELHRFRPNLVHTHLLHGDLYGQLVARLGRVPAVSSFHGVHSFFTREPVRSAERLAGRLAQRTIAISDHVRDFLLRSRLRPPERIRVIPYGVDPREWQLTAEERARARACLGLGDDDVAVGIASRLIPGKGHDLLLRAFVRARADVPTLCLLVAGDGPLRGEFARVSQRLDASRIRMLGFVSDVQSFMASCDILAFPTLPTLGEGFGLAALEAMAAGRPVIATGVASLPEIVADGETGILVPPNHPLPLATALTRLARNRKLREQLGASGRRRAFQMFGLGGMIASTLSVYRECGLYLAGDQRHRSRSEPR
jgi:glycosyltransferase involved in cell wall biosynthesis